MALRSKEGVVLKKVILHPNAAMVLPIVGVARYVSAHWGPS